MANNLDLLLCRDCTKSNNAINIVASKLSIKCLHCNCAMTEYKWSLGSSLFTKSTIICSDCSELKNICQSCLLDFQQGVPATFKDNSLKKEHKLYSIPENKAFRDHLFERLKKNKNIYKDVYNDPVNFLRTHIRQKIAEEALVENVVVSAEKKPKNSQSLASLRENYFSGKQNNYVATNFAEEKTKQENDGQNRYNVILENIISINPFPN